MLIQYNIISIVVYVQARRREGTGCSELQGPKGAKGDCKVVKDVYPGLCIGEKGYSLLSTRVLLKFY